MTHLVSFFFFCMVSNDDGPRFKKNFFFHIVLLLLLLLLFFSSVCNWLTIPIGCAFLYTLTCQLFFIITDKNK